MNKKNIFSFILVLLFAGAASVQLNAAEPVKLQSPDGQLELTFELRDGVPYYALNRLNKPVVLPSKMGFTLEWRDDLAQSLDRKSVV